TYKVNDGYFDSDNAVQVSIFVDRAPVALNDGTFEVLPNTTLTKDALTGVLHNDTDPDGDALTVTPDSLRTSHGSVTIDSNGSFSYPPDQGYHNGPDAFSYVVSDGITSSSATVHLFVVNQSPVASNYSFRDPASDGWGYVNGQYSVDVLAGPLPLGTDPD